MKIIMLTILIGIFSVSLMAQEKSEKKIAVPAEVKSGFQKDYKDQQAKWDMEDGAFEASFKMNGLDVSALYDKTGHRKEVEMEIKLSELPVSATEYLNKNYMTYKLMGAAKITTDKNIVTYEAEMGKDGKSLDVIFNSGGKFIKQVEGD